MHRQDLAGYVTCGCRATSVALLILSMRGGLIQADNIVLQFSSVSCNLQAASSMLLSRQLCEPICMR